jgi:hypothetical protein
MLIRRNLALVSFEHNDPYGERTAIRTPKAFATQRGSSYGGARGEAIGNYYHDTGHTLGVYASGS